MKLKNIHKTAGQQVQDWAVENQRLQGGEKDLNEQIIDAFSWRKTKEGVSFWDDVNNGLTEQELKEKYPEVPWKPKTPKEIAQNLLKGVSDEVLEEIKKQLETNKTK